jgi:hypothetical protein
MFQYFGYLLEPVVEIWQSFFLVWKSGELGPLIFFSKKSFVCVKIVFLDSKK